MQCCVAVMWAFLGALALAGGAAAARIGQSAAVQAELWEAMTNISRTAPQSLTNHNKQFTPKQIIQVAPDVWVAVGYCLSNSVLIRGNGGLIIVDVLDSDVPAREVAAEFRRLTMENGRELPVTGIIYTHNHPDHISGGKVFADLSEPGRLEVWSHKLLPAEFEDKWLYNNPLLLARGIRQVGALLPDNIRINSGLGPGYVTGPGTGLLPVPPNRLLDGETKDIEISGVKMRLIHIPGETRDQMGVFLHDYNLFVSGDDYYHSFPNLYAIRGTPPRPVADWIASIDLMIGLDIDTLVPNHHLPVTGTDEIRRRLTDYRDAIQYTRDQTLRVMNTGAHPDLIARLVTLPPELRDKEYLLEHYGAIEWSVKTVMEAQVGWFSGAPEELYPPHPVTGACREVDLLGRRGLSEHDGDGPLVYTDGCNALMTSRDRGRCIVVKEAADIAANPYSEEEDLRWGLRIVTNAINCDHLNYQDYKATPDSAIAEYVREAKRIRGLVAVRLANLQTSPNGRNYLLTYTVEENTMGPTQGINPNANNVGPIMLLPYSKLFRKLTVMLDPEKVTGQSWLIRFENAGVIHTLTVRNSIMLVKEAPVNEAPAAGDPDLTVSLAAGSQAELSMRRVLLRAISPAAFSATAGVTVREPRLTVQTFFSWFDNPNDFPKYPYQL